MNNLQLGIEAYKKGELEEAEKYIRAALNENPKDENAWAWLYQISDNPEMKIVCLRKILEINPANEQARKQLNTILPRKITPPPTGMKYKVPVSSEKKSDPKQARNILIGIGAVLTLCFICICAVWFYDPPSGPKDYKMWADIQCRLYVEDRLKAPSTADFPASSLTDIRDVGNNVFEIRSYVDAQNSFGATIRTDYFCKIQYLGTAEDDETNPVYWSLLQLDLFE